MSDNFFRTALVVSMAIGGVGVAEAQEGDKDWYIKAGLAHLTLDDEADFTVGGAPFPTGALETDPQLTASVEIGKFVTRNISVGYTFGFPPTAEAEGAGGFAGLGRLADVTYGPMALTAQYHFMATSQFSPYLGAGLSYMWIMDTEDAALTGVDAEDDLGLVLQAGANFKFNDDWSMFVDVKKADLSTTATGFFGAAPISADVEMNPLVISTGLGFKF